MASPRFEIPFVFKTDVSIEGLGAILSQVQENGRLHPVAYASRALSQSEKKYGITELETLAIVWSVSHFCMVTKSQYSYHSSAVQVVLQNPNANGKHARWWSKVYGRGIADPKIMYQAGRENINADALSRCSQQPAPTMTNAEIEFHASVTNATSDCTIADLLQVDPTNVVSHPHSFAEEQWKDKRVNEMILFLETVVMRSDLAREHSSLFRAGYSTSWTPDTTSTTKLPFQATSGRES